MNCLEFRHARLVQAASADPAAAAHASQCPACTAFAGEIDALDELVRQALRVPVPEGLADRILLRRRLAPQARGRRWAWIAAAASIAGVVLLLSRETVRDPGEPLARSAIAHVLSEPDTLAAHEPLPRERLARSLAAAGGSLRSEIGVLTYLGTCQMPQGPGQHAVLETPAGQVSLILVPGPSQRTRRAITRDGLTAAVMPAGSGSLAVVGSEPGRVALAQGLIERGIEWAPGAQ